MMGQYRQYYRQGQTLVFAVPLHQHASDVTQELQAGQLVAGRKITGESMPCSTVRRLASKPTRTADQQLITNLQVTEDSCCFAQACATGTPAFYNPIVTSITGLLPVAD